MLKTLRLDWAAIKYYRRRFFLIPLSLFLIGWSTPILLIPVGAVLCFFYSGNIFAVEEKGDLNKLYLTLPIERKWVVASRYLSAIAFVACGMLLGGALMPVANCISWSKWYPDARWLFVLFSFSVLLFALMTLFMYPLLFKLGYQKGKLWGMYLPYGVFIIAYIVLMEYPLITGNGTFITDLLVYASGHMFQTGGGMLGMAAVILASSWALSLRIYSKREF